MLRGDLPCVNHGFAAIYCRLQTGDTLLRSWSLPTAKPGGEDMKGMTDGPTSTLVPSCMLVRAAKGHVRENLLSRRSVAKVND